MSFYGSVYYQLVDAFTKIVLGNKGINIDNQFGAGSTALEGSQAIGRKGVFGFDTGNRWIVFDENTVRDEETGKDFTICEIYHNKPDTKNTKPLNGFKVLSKAEAEANTDPITQLEYADTFETYETKYDNAGHVASSERKVYKLPKAEVNERVTTLENLVGTDEGRQLPLLEDVNDRNLYGYVEENTKDISTLERNLGEWGTDVYNGYSKIDSVCDLIGNFTKVLSNSSYVGYDEAKSLADILGSYPNLIKLSYDGTNPTTIIDSIIRGKNQLDALSETVSTNKTNTDVQVNGVAALIGNPIDNDSIYDHVKNLYDITNWDNREDTVSGAIEALKTADTTINANIDDIEDDIKSINDNINNGINARINGLETRIGNHEQNWNGTEQALKEVDKALQDVDKTLQAKDTELEGKIAQTKTDILSIIGEVSTDKTVMGTMNEQDTALNNLINGLRADLGQKTGASDAFTAIGANAASIEEINSALGTINTKIGEVSDKSLAAQIGDINVNLQQYAKSSELDAHKQLAESTYVTKTALADANYVSTSELEAKGYALDTTVTGISNQVKEIEKNFTTLGIQEDFTSEVPENTTLLRAIFDQLKTLNDNLTIVQSDIVTIKGKMNELHSENPPFPAEEKRQTT